MRRSSTMGPDPDRDDETVLDRLRSAAARLLERSGAGGRQQALPLSQARGQSGPVVPYQERRQQLMRARGRQHGPYAFVFILVLLVLVVGLFYGLSWALGGVLSLGGGARTAATPTVLAKPTVPAAPVTSASPQTSILPTPGSGTSLPSPSPGPDGTSPAGAAPGGSATATPIGQRSYVVKAGDTPGEIARMFNVSVEALMRVNGITDARSLKVGQTLIIPPESTPTPR